MVTQGELEGLVQRAVGRALQTHDTCSRFSNEEVVMIKRRLRSVDRVANAVGYAVIIAMTGFVLTLIKFGWTIWNKDGGPG